MKKLNSRAGIRIAYAVRAFTLKVTLELDLQNTEELVPLTSAIDLRGADELWWVDGVSVSDVVGQYGYIITLRPDEQVEGQPQAVEVFYNTINGNYYLR